MASPRRKRKKVIIKPRFYLFLAIFIAIIVWLAIALVRYFSPPIVKWGRLSTDQEISAIIVREEKILLATESGKFENVAAEGAYIEQGEEIALLYESDFEEEDLDTLIDVRQQIKNYQEENILKNVIHEDLEVLDTEITRLINEIADLVRAGKDRILPAKEHELNSLMEQRRVYLNENLHRDSTLETKFLREEVLIEKIEKSTIKIYAPDSGMISFFLDGLEGYLTKEKIESINIDDYLLYEDKILNYTTESNINVGSVVTADQPIYRIITPDHWFAIIKMPRSKNTLVKGRTCDITFENYGNAMSNVYVNDVKIYGKEAIIVLEFNTPIGPMASLRIVSGSLGRSNEGFVVPLEYITVNEGRNGIWVVKEDKSQAFIPINVVAQNYIEAVVEAGPDSAEQIKEGLKLVKP